MLNARRIFLNSWLEYLGYGVLSHVHILMPSSRARMRTSFTGRGMFDSRTDACRFVLCDSVFVLRGFLVASKFRVLVETRR